MKLHEALDIDLNKDELVCFVGAGGKTTSMFKLAKELRGNGKSVLVTTTTAIYYPAESDCDEVIVNDSKNIGCFTAVKPGSISVFGRAHSKENKLLGTDKQYISEIYKKKLFHYVLVEGDGSKHRPIKAPAYNEPVIPDNTTKVTGVIGLDSLGKRIDDGHVHRPEIFCKVTRAEPGAVMSEDVIGKLIVAQDGLFKAVPQKCRKYLLLNKSENEQRNSSARRIIDFVKRERADINGFIVANMIDGTINRVK